MTIKDLKWHKSGRWWFARAQGFVVGFIHREKEGEAPYAWQSTITFKGSNAFELKDAKRCVQDHWKSYVTSITSP